MIRIKLQTRKLRHVSFSKPLAAVFFLLQKMAITYKQKIIYFINHNYSITVKGQKHNSLFRPKDSSDCCTFHLLNRLLCFYPFTVIL